MTNFGWDLPPGVSIGDIDAQVDEEPLAFETHDERRELVRRIWDALPADLQIDLLSSVGNDPEIIHIMWDDDNYTYFLMPRE